MQDFLKAYSIPSDIRLNKGIWKKFFRKVVHCFPTAKLHSFLSEFLKSVSQKYVNSGRAFYFIHDLLFLDVKKLLSGKSENLYLQGLFKLFIPAQDDDKESLDVKKIFSDFLHEYINRNSLQGSLLSEIASYIVGHCILFIPLYPLFYTVDNFRTKG